MQQIDLHGPGIKAQGAAVPGLAMYILIGRTPNYAWSLTSAGHDVRDVYAEKLCEPDGSEPTRDSDHYMFDGNCREFVHFNAGTLNGEPLTYDVSAHGPVFATATIDGEPYALSRRRSTFGRDGLNLAALKDMTEGDASTPNKFFTAANKFGFTFNWAYTSRKKNAFFSSGRLPVRPPGLDRRLPTIGTGDYEWTGYLSRNQHPHDVSGPRGLLLNWNNQSAPGFMHGDDEPYGSAQRVELFNQWPRDARITDVVGIMNRAATEDVRSPVWPVVSQVLHTGTAPTPRDQQVVDLLDAWVADDAPRLDADEDLTFDHAGPEIMDRLWRPIADAVMQPVFGDLLDDLNDVRGPRWAVGPLLRGQGPADAARQERRGAVPPLLLRRRLAGGLPRLAVAGRTRRGRRSSRPSSAAPIRRPGSATPIGRASRRGSCRTRSRRPTGRPSSRSSSSSAALTSVQVQVREELLGLAPAPGRHLQVDVAPAEAVELVVARDHGLDAGVGEVPAPGLGRVEVLELPDDLPVVEARIADLEPVARRGPGPP